MSRIIAGRARGRRLNVPGGARTRPTTDRVREALFSAVTSWAGGIDAGAEAALRGIGFLDLYAGSGAVGLEAASRGAGPVLLVEADRRTADLCRRNASASGLQVQVRCAKVETLLAAGPTSAAFDVIWLDPPYEMTSERLDRIVDTALAGGWLADGGMIVAERPSRVDAPRWPTRLGESWSRRYGETILYFATWQSEDADMKGPQL